MFLGNESNELDSNERDSTGSKRPELLRICWVGSQETLETSGRILGPLAIGLCDEFVELTLVCPEAADLSGLPSPPIKLIQHLPVNWPILHGYRISQLERAVSQAKPHLIHALDAASVPLARRLGQLCGVNHVATAWSLGDSKHMGILHHRPSAVLAADREVADDLIRHHWTPADRIEVIPPGVLQVRKPTCFADPSHSGTIILSGPLDCAPAFATAIESFAELLEADFDCSFFVIVGGKAERQLRRLVEQLGLRHDVTFVDRKPMSRLPGIFKASDIYISVGPDQKLDVHALLAMAAGVPVLATKKAVGQFVHNADAAIRIDANDSKRLTAKLASLLKNPDEARSAAQRSLDYLQENHTAAKMVHSHLEVYGDIVSSQPAPGHSQVPAA